VIFDSDMRGNDKKLTNWKKTFLKIFAVITYMENTGCALRSDVIIRKRIKLKYKFLPSYDL